jgi:hypothetical protein
MSDEPLSNENCLIKDNIILDCESAKNTGELAAKIYEAVYNSDPKIMIYTPDALLRVFVHLAYKNDWSLEKLQKETSVAIRYYYSHEELTRDRPVP